jgi:peptide deformylase
MLPKLSPRLEEPTALSSMRSMQSGTHVRIPVRPVVEHPDPCLGRPAEEINPVDPVIVEIANVLIATMRVTPACLGLSAPQVGENVRLFAMNVTGHKGARSCAGLVILANPVILARAGNVLLPESCASVPHLAGDVARSAEVIVSGYVPGSGRKMILASDGIEARCIQHELDHLDGILFVERVLDPIAERVTGRRPG